MLSNKLLSAQYGVDVRLEILQQSGLKLSLEIPASCHNKGTIKDLPKTLEHHGNMAPMGMRGPSNSPSICIEGPAFRVTDLLAIQATKGPYRCDESHLQLKKENASQRKYLTMLLCLQRARMSASVLAFCTSALLMSSTRTSFTTYLRVGRYYAYLFGSSDFTLETDAVIHYQ